MFTGIIQQSGQVEATGSQLSLTLKKPLKGVVLGSSVAVNGVCLTVNSIKKSVYSFDVMQETLKKTTLGLLQKSDSVNIETALKVGDELGGHFVYGHVDGLGKIKKIEKKQNDLLLTVEPPRELLKFCAPQGSITISGVSLTIAKLTKKNFKVSLVPFTVAKTNLGKFKKGDIINIECDMLAKYIYGLKTK